RPFRRAGLPQRVLVVLSVHCTGNVGSLIGQPQHWRPQRCTGYDRDVRPFGSVAFSRLPAPARRGAQWLVAGAEPDADRADTPGVLDGAAHAAGREQVRHAAGQLIFAGALPLASRMDSIYCMNVQYIEVRNAY